MADDSGQDDLISGGALTADTGGQPDAATVYARRAALADPDAAAHDPYLAGALSKGAPNDTNAYADDQQAYADSLRGNSPLSQYEALKEARDQNAAYKSRKIQDAMNILSASHGSQTTNLPLLAAAGAFLKPTRTGGFSESLGNAFEAAIPPTEQQRQRDMEFAKAQGALGVEGSDVPLQMSDKDMQDWFNTQKLAEQAGANAAIVGGRSQVAGINQAGRLSAAQIASGARVTAAQIAADKPNWVYVGNDPMTGQGVWFNKTVGPSALNYGPKIDPKNATDGPKLAEARGLVANKIAPDIATAYAMVRAGTQDYAKFSQAVTARENALSLLPGAGQMSADQLHTMASEQVTAEFQKNVPSKSNPGAAPASPAPAPAPPPPVPVQKARAATDAELQSARSALTRAGNDPAKQAAVRAEIQRRAKAANVDMGDF